MESAVAVGTPSSVPAPAARSGSLPPLSPPMGSSSSAIAAHGLTKVYGKLVAVDHVDLDVREGSVFGLLGPNGAGKTTVIKLLTGLAAPSAGSASVAGFDIQRQPMHVKANIGWVAAEVILDDDLSGWENLQLQARLQRLSDWKGRADQLLDYFELGDRKRDRVSTYSTGMRKKMEIALALLHQPRVVFMDEPTVGLDANVRRMLWELIRGVNREYGITIFLTTHYIEEADALCDHVAIIDRGKIVASGSPTELKSRIQHDYLEVELADGVDARALSTLRGVSEVRPQPPAFLLKVSSAEETLPSLFEAYPGRSIHRLNIERPSLESVFIDITGQRINSAGGDTQDFRKFYMNLRRARR
jgi:ABC-2 type transport system ATP-binding protein